MWRRCRISIAVALAVAGLPLEGFGQGVLDDIRGDVRRSAPEHSAAPAAKSNARDADDDCGLLSEFFGAAFGQAMFFPFAAGSEALARAQPFPLFFLDHPYQGNFPGFLARDLLGSKDFADVWQDRISQRTWFGRLSLDEGYDFFDGVNRAGGSLLLDSTTRLGAQTNWSVFSVETCDGRIDSLAVGNMNLTYRYFESRRIMMRAGLGANTLVDRQATEWGFNFHLDSDWFLKRPFVATSVFDVGTLGAATLVHLRGQIGVVRNHCEFFGGYDWLQIGSTGIHGPMIGIRIWF